MGAVGWLRRVGRRHPHADVAVAATLFAVTLATTSAGPGQVHGRLSAAAVPLAAVAWAPLVVRRKWPFPVLVVSTVAAEAYLMPHWTNPSWLILAAPLIVLYTVAEHSARRWALLVGGLVVVAGRLDRGGEHRERGEAGRAQPGQGAGNRVEGEHRGRSLGGLPQHRGRVHVPTLPSPVAPQTRFPRSWRSAVACVGSDPMQLSG
jgi:hypothetical protein